MNKLIIHPFIDEETNTVTYVVTDKASKQSAVIDSVLNFNPYTGKLTSHGADKIIQYLDENNFQLEWILETHAHDDHITASSYLQEKRGGLIGLSKHIKKVQCTIKKWLNLKSDLPCDGSQFDHLFEDDEIIKLGHLEIEIMHTPGHTPACVSYKIESTVFVGDTLLMPDFGTARTDFPSGSARSLYQSIQRILSLSDSTCIYVGHSYKSPTQETYSWETTVLQEKHHNIDVKQGITEDMFVQLRTTKNSLSPHRCLFPVIQINIRAGTLPKQESNGISYLKMPITVAFS